MALSDLQKQTILGNLQGRISGACPMCTMKNWTLGDSIVGATTASLSGGIALGGPFIPMIQLVCGRCGFVAHHAVGALGIKLEQ